MNRKIVYSNEPLGDIEVVPDFLPRPAELAAAPLGRASRKRGAVR